MKRFLVTGSQGLIGRHLTARILRDGGEVLGIGRSPELPGSFTHRITIGDDARRAPFAEDLGDHYRYRQIPLVDGNALRQAIESYRPDCVVHLASALHTAAERELFDTNVQGTSVLVDALAALPGARLILGSSGSVYGEPAELPIRESLPCNPADLYGVSKLAAEHVARVKAARSGLALVVARIFNVVGPGQKEDHVCGRFAAQIAAGADVVDTGPLKTTRDFIDVRDVGAALLLLARQGAPGATYNVASGREVSIREVVTTLLTVAGSSARVVPRPGVAAGVARHVADIARLRELGFATAFSLRQSLADLHDYYRGLQHAS